MFTVFLSGLLNAGLLGMALLFQAEGTKSVMLAELPVDEQSGSSSLSLKSASSSSSGSFWQSASGSGCCSFHSGCGSWKSCGTETEISKGLYRKFRFVQVEVLTGSWQPLSDTRFTLTLDSFSPSLLDIQHKTDQRRREEDRHMEEITKQITSCETSVNLRYCLITLDSSTW